jgi:hypothetical protein
VPPRPPARFLLYSRPGCHLCELMLEELAGVLSAGEYRVDIADVDADPITRVRWGHKIPVLLLGGELVCHGYLDPDKLHKALAQLR